MDLIVGFDDLKYEIARAVNRQLKMNFLLEGPPACAKSLMLEGVRQAVPEAYMAFGSRTSAAGLSEALFERNPRILLLDEADKMDNDTLSVLLGVMESGEILETKSRNTRGIKLETMVLAACNSSKKFTPEFLSRFALHPHFPAYTRDEFIDVCHGFLSKAENCPPEMARRIGQLVFDYKLGDVRKARGVWQLMDEASESEVQRAINLIQKYSPESARRHTEKAEASRLPGM
jgi:replication-associated recombination protein RarA